MRRNLPRIVLALVVTLFVGVQSAWAGTSVLSGTLTTASPFYPNPPGQPIGDCTAFDPSGVFYYEVRTFSVTVSGTYRFVDQFAPIDGWLIFYSAFPNSAAPFSNCIKDIDDNDTISLVAGQEYFVAISTFSDGVTGSISYSVSGPGELIFPNGCAGGNFVNCGAGDEYAQVFNATVNNASAVDVWCISASGVGSVGGTFTAAEIAAFPDHPAANTLVETINCRVPVSFYILTTGEYQINIGPDNKGNSIALIFSGLPMRNVRVIRLDADR